ncbi:hypothetical protein CRUP_035020, partial [Coryphaenoides rupestris]
GRWVSCDVSCGVSCGVSCDVSCDLLVEALQLHLQGLQEALSLHLLALRHPERLYSPQELDQMKYRISRDEVNVEVDSAQGPDLGNVLASLRSQYEDIVHKNKEQAELWYRKK